MALKTKVEYIVPYHSDGGQVCTYEECIFPSFEEAEYFLENGRRCWGKVGKINHICAANGWAITLPMNKVSIRVKFEGK